MVLNAATKTDLVSAKSHHTITVNKDPLSFYKKPDNVKDYLGHIENG